MNRMPILAGTASIIAVSGFWAVQYLSQEHDERVSRTPAEEQAVSTAEPASRPTLPEPPVADSESPPAREDHGSTGIQTYTGPAPAQGVLISDIPESRFKQDLLKLSADLQRKVLKKLSEKPQLLSDVDSLRVDPAAMLYYTCSFGLQGERGGADTNAAERLEAPAAGEAETEASAAPVPISSPPALHSRPGAANVLFLDFNGHVVEGTAWNASRGVDSWNCLPYDTDGDTNTFSSSEMSTITQAWERVAEDYAPFDVDVTTEQPATWSSTTGHALITPGVDANGTDCPHKNYGGIAYLDVFGRSYYSYNYFGSCYSPVWIKNYGAANAAEAIAHELGHNLDLAHDGLNDESGNNIDEYYDGHANGSISWGTIMGSAYGENVTQWSRGDYYRASNTADDDLAILAGFLDYRPDDHGSDNGTATPLPVDSWSGTVSQEGVIETTGDPDVFSFSTGSGTIDISASPYRASSGTWGGNLDILLELYNDEGALLATNNPALATDARIAVNVSAGSYYLHVKPVGVGNPMAGTPTGYANYASLGQYRISGFVSTDADDDGIPNEWEVRYFGGVTNAIPTDDTDGDGSDNLTEYIAGYDPLDPDSVFRITSFAAPTTGESSFIVTWNPVEGRLYSVQYGNDLTSTGFDGIPDALDLPYTRSSYTDTVERVGSAHFYRVEVRLINP